MQQRLCNKRGTEMKRTIIFLLFLLGVSAMNMVEAQVYELSLDSCHRLAEQHNLQNRIDSENQLAARYARQAVFARFFPQVSANGAYAWNSRHAYALPQQMNTHFGQVGLDGISFTNPTLQAIEPYFPRTADWVDQTVGAYYGDLYRQFDLDFTHVFVGQVGVTQPIYVGGRIIWSHKMMRSMEHIAELKAKKNQTELLIQVDEAYWRVLSVEEKRKLAMQYAALLRQLDKEVEVAQAEGVATSADVLQVKMTLSEAEASLAQAEDGLVLSKMALCQLVGLPLTADIKLTGNAIDSVSLLETNVDMEQVKAHRGELQMLSELSEAAKAGVGLAAADLQPNIVASANYIVTNPNLTDGFKKDFAGFFSAGVVVNLPIAHASDILAVKAAKHKARTAELQLEEAQQKIELQATQSAQKVADANRQLVRAQQVLAHSEEILRYAQESYAEGLLTSTDLMKAQTAWHKAYSDKIDAAIALRMAEITYKQHTGQL